MEPLHSTRLYLDDERTPPPGWTLVRWPDEMIALLAAGGVAEISLDHDLGDDARGTGYDVLLWIERVVALEGFTPPSIHVHTANSAARSRMEAAVEAIARLARRATAMAMLEEQREELDRLPRTSLPNSEVLRRLVWMRRASTGALLCYPFLDTDTTEELPLVDAVLAERGWNAVGIRCVRAVFMVGLWHQFLALFDWVHLDHFDVLQGYAMLLLLIGVLALIVSPWVGLTLIGVSVVAIAAAFVGMRLSRWRLERRAASESEHTP